MCEGAVELAGKREEKQKLRHWRELNRCGLDHNMRIAGGRWPVWE